MSFGEFGEVCKVKRENLAPAHKSARRIQDEDYGHTRIALMRASVTSPDYSASLVVSKSCHVHQS